jgi:nucleolysin TIA-1/TIAR
MQVLNGRKVMDQVRCPRPPPLLPDPSRQEIRVNWAYQSNNTTKEDTTSHHHIFVGDLSNEVSDEILQKAFSIFGTVSEARVMWDYKTGRSRGFGFVSFRARDEAETAMAKMDGEWLGSRQIRCNWANQKGQPPYAQQQMMHMGMAGPGSPYAAHPPFPSGGMQSYEMVLSQAPSYQATCYVGNLTPNTVQGDLVPLFMNFGPIIEARMQSDRGFAFIKMQTHEAAAAAIVSA